MRGLLVGTDGIDAAGNAATGVSPPIRVLMYNSSRKSQSVDDANSFAHVEVVGVASQGVQPHNTPITHQDLTAPSNNSDQGATSKGCDASLAACPAFADESEYDEFVDAIAPSKNLICPITQELVVDPVVAEDGHTYERSAIMRWFSLGRTRSPVTNSIMNGHRIYPNVAVQGMATGHRELLGRNLLIRAAWVHDNHGVCPDNGARICALLDAGADLSVRDGSDLNDSSTATTALLHLIRSSNLSLARALLLYNAPVNANNDDGKVYLRAAEKMLRSQYANMAGERREEWRDFIEEIKKKANFEKELKAEKDRARAMANDEHRAQQRSLAADARRRSGDGTFRGAHFGHDRGIGVLDDGWGYFPSLVALQFQGAIPPASASVAQLEQIERKRLGRILRILGIIIASYLILS